MSGDALPQPPAPSDDEREAAACAWADHRKHYGASTDPELLARDHRNYLAGYYDGRREQRDADKLARNRPEHTTEQESTTMPNTDRLDAFEHLDAVLLEQLQRAGSSNPGDDLSGYRSTIHDAIRAYVDQITDGEPEGEILPAELGTVEFHGDPLPVVAIRAAVDLVGSPGRIGGTAENATKAADTLLSWLRKETGEPAPEQPAAASPFPERSVAQIAEQLERDLAPWVLAPSESERLVTIVTRRTVHGR